jgi:hypothetical protein
MFAIIIEEAYKGYITYAFILHVNIFFPFNISLRLSSGFLSTKMLISHQETINTIIL